MNSTRHPFKSKLYYPFDDKEYMIEQEMERLLLRCMEIGKWEGLPKTIPERILVEYLLIDGYVGIYEHSGKAGKDNYHYTNRSQI